MSQDSLKPVDLPRSRPDIARSLEAVRGALETMRYGAISLAIHDGRVVQLDVTERTRFTSGAF